MPEETTIEEGRVVALPETRGYVMNQTMLRIKDPQRSLEFYTKVLGMTLVKEFRFPEMEFTLYFVGYVTEDDEPLPEDAQGRAAYAFRQKAMIELTHNWGTEIDGEFPGYHNGNDDPRGFGHIGLSVPDVRAACDRFEELGVEFVKRPNDGRMKGLAFIRDPDGYWIEILEANSCGAMALSMGESTIES